MARRKKPWHGVKTTRGIVLNITPSTTAQSQQYQLKSVHLFKSPPYFDWFLRHCHRRAERPRASPLLAGLAYGCSSGAASARQVPQNGAVIPIQIRAVDFAGSSVNAVGSCRMGSQVQGIRRFSLLLFATAVIFASAPHLCAASFRR